MRPVIGIPCQADFRAGSKRPIYGNNRTYVHAIENAGGLPILIPLVNDFRALESLLPRLDGILFSGGIDLHPSLYGEEKHPATDESDPRLDEFEMALAGWALQEDLPILGVCRGMQLLNVALGGNLYQDIASQYDGALDHCRRDLPRTALTHEVAFEAGSLVEKIMGTYRLSVNSLHHQGVREPGQGVRITGRADDGMAEMLEVPGRRFVVAAQGHPEELYAHIPACSRFFQAFVAACANLPFPEEESASAAELQPPVLAEVMS